MNRLKICAGKFYQTALMFLISICHSRYKWKLFTRCIKVKENCEQFQIRIQYKKTLKVRPKSFDLTLNPI